MTPGVAPDACRICGSPSRRTSVIPSSLSSTGMSLGGSPAWISYSTLHRSFSFLHARRGLRAGPFPRWSAVIGFFIWTRSAIGRNCWTSLIMASVSARMNSPPWKPGAWSLRYVPLMGSIGLRSIKFGPIPEAFLKIFGLHSSSFELMLCETILCL